MVLTIGQMKQGDDNFLCVAPVKNRYGKADQTGNNYVTLSFNPESMHDGCRFDSHNLCMG